MEIAITVLLLIVGLVLIIKGGDFFVDAASWMAARCVSIIYLKQSSVKYI